LRPKQYAVKRQRITAPISGKVVDPKITSEEGVITRRESILDIVPDVLDLLVKARIKSKDINLMYEHSFADFWLTPFL
jgi:HlyD family secretion protein